MVLVLLLVLVLALVLLLVLVLALVLLLVLVLALVLVLVLVLALVLVLVLLLLFASFFLVVFFPSVRIVRTFVPCSAGLFLSGLVLCIPVAFVPSWLLLLLGCPLARFSVLVLLVVSPLFCVLTLGWSLSFSLALVLASSLSFPVLPCRLFGSLWRAYDVPPSLSFYP
ncbi:MAG: hypothetical protein QXN96_02695 [Candidatus Bathyarchaeia archaeon]